MIIRLLSLIVFLLSDKSIAATDHLAQLQAYLSSLKAQQPISTQVNLFKENSRDDDDVKTLEVNLSLKAQANEFQIIYNDSEIEKLEKQKGMQNNVNPLALKNKLSYAKELNKLLSEHQFVNQVATSYQGKAALLLTFNLIMDKIVWDKKIQKHVDDFAGTLQLWLTPEFVPIASNLTYTGSGSYFLIFNAEVKSTINTEYSVVADRLIVISENALMENSSTFGEQKKIQQTKVQIIQ